jgi:hypothetical protein
MNILKTKYLVINILFLFSFYLNTNAQKPRKIFNYLQDNQLNLAIEEYNKIVSNKEYDNEIGNSVWFTKRFYEWAENNRTQCRIIYFYDSDDEEKKPHIAIIIEDLVLDFTHKKLSEDPKEKFYIGHPKTYIKYGYDKYELLDDFPNWTEKAKSLKYI